MLYMPLDLAKHSPAIPWKHFKEKGKSVVMAALDRRMANFDKLPSLPSSNIYADSHLFDVHPADVPCAAALNTNICPHKFEVTAAIDALKRNKSSDLYGMQSECNIDAASHLTCSFGFYCCQYNILHSCLFQSFTITHLEAFALLSRASPRQIPRCDCGYCPV